MIRTNAPQQGHMAAGARPCSVLGGGYQWNASVVMWTDSFGFATTITAKRPARHLGGQPT
jgi:hypothetical protein